MLLQGLRTFIFVVCGVNKLSHTIFVEPSEKNATVGYFPEGMGLGPSAPTASQRETQNRILFFNIIIFCKFCLYVLFAGMQT